jgi:hypothetical protein
MFATSSLSFSPFPPINHSRISNPALISTLCSAFGLDEIDSESFTISLVTEVFVDKIQSFISPTDFISLQAVPLLVRVVINEFGSDGVTLVFTRILPTIEEAYTASSGSRRYLELYLDGISSVPGCYRERYVVGRIIQVVDSPNLHLRILSVHMITLVRRGCQVASAFLSLSRDCEAMVRIECLTMSKYCNFDETMLESVFREAAEDELECVRKAAAAVYGDVVPHYPGPYGALLSDPTTMCEALDSFISVAQYSGLDSVFVAFRVAVKAFPKRCARILLELAPIASPNDQPLLFKAGRLLKHCSTFVKSLFTFSRCFESVRPFSVFFNVSKMRDVRERILYANQCFLFISALGSELVEIALAFAHDEAPEVRLASVPILIALCKSDPTAIGAVSRLARSPREQRVVLAHVIQELGPSQFHNVLDDQELLKADEQSEDEKRVGMVKFDR